MVAETSPQTTRLTDTTAAQMVHSTLSGAGSPLLAGFVAALDPVNAAADAAPGFIWRLQTEDGNATAVHAFEWNRAASAGVLVNMPVWESVEALASVIGWAIAGSVLKLLAYRRGL